MKKAGISDPLDLNEMLKNLGDEAFIDFADKVYAAREEAQERIDQRNEKIQDITKKVKEIHRLFEDDNLICDSELFLQFMLWQQGLAEIPVFNAGENLDDKARDERARVKPKYRFPISETETQTWTGRGAMPLPLKALIDEDMAKQGILELTKEKKSQLLKPYLINEEV